MSWFLMEKLKKKQYDFLNDENNKINDKLCQSGVQFLWNNFRYNRKKEEDVDKEKERKKERAREREKEREREREREIDR